MAPQLGATGFPAGNRPGRP